jgi:hypothetical protein
MRMATGGQGTAATPHSVSWQIIPVGDGLARRLAVDPRQLLRLRGITPVPSSAAAPESECEVILLDSSGAPETYAGPVEGLPHSASRLMQLRWLDPRDGTLRRWMRPAGADVDHHISAYRSKLEQIRDALQGASPIDRLLTKEELEFAARTLETADLMKPIPMTPGGALFR